MSRYRCIQAERAFFPITVLCRVLGVARSGSYAWQRRPLSARQQRDQQLQGQITAIHAASRGTYGVPRVHAALHQHGASCGRKRVARLMRQEGLRGVQRGRARPRTTTTDPSRLPAPNLLNRVFVAAASNRIWVGDVTSVPTGEGWRYLAVVLATYSRRVIGWAMADHLRTELPLAALTMALRRRPAPGLIHHTDRGCQDTAASYHAVLAAYALSPSMSRAGDCSDNALAESFFATFKSELVDDNPWATRQDAQRAIFEWIAVVPNRQRLPSALSYCAPVTFESHEAARTLIA